MSKTVDLKIPKTAEDRASAQRFNQIEFPVTNDWLERLCAHIDEGGLIGEPAARSLLGEVIRQRGLPWDGYK